MKAVMITGATGFIGSHIAERLLQANVCVSLWVRRTNSCVSLLEKAGARLFVDNSLDLTSLPSSMEGADTIIHCAGATRALNMQQYYAANVGLTRQILSLTGPHQRMVFISSQAAAGPSDSGVPIDEHAPPRPISQYGKTKLVAEHCIRQWGLANDNKFVILRPGVVYGPREKGLYNYFKWVRRGFLPLINHGQGLISILHVDDAVRAVLTAAEKSPEGETYFVSNDRGCSLQDLGRAIQTALNKTRLIKLELPVRLFNFAAGVLDAAAHVTRRPALLSREKVLEMKQPAWLCSNSKIKDKLGWQPVISLEDGIKQTVDWYIQEGWL